MSVLCMVVHFCVFVVEWSACLLNAGGYGGASLLDAWEMGKRTEEETTRHGPFEPPHA